MIDEKFGDSDEGARRDAQADPEVQWDDAHPWPTLDAHAYYGLAGEIVRTILPQTEADPAALLFTLLTAGGNIAGGGVRARVQDDDHPARLFVAIIGATSSGAKGTSFATVRPIIRAAAPEWHEQRMLNGFGSGEAVIAELAPQRAEDPDAPPAFLPDPRLLAFEPEFSRILAVNSRDGSTQSMILRQAWDGGRLAVRRSKSRLVAPDTHISVIGHITPDELRGKLTSTDCTSGFANRFLFVLSQRSKKLPTGGYIEPAVIGDFARRLHAVVTDPAPRVLHRTPEAEEFWREIYMAEPDRDGLIGALTARPAAQRLRLAVAYAILDGAQEINVDHLRAADACWRYSVASIEHLFGGLRGDDVQDRLLDALRDEYPDGLTGAQQGDQFGKNLKVGQLKVARDALESRGLIRTERAEGDGKRGRPTIISFAVPRSDRPDKGEQADLIRINTSLLLENTQKEALQQAADLPSETVRNNTEKTPIDDKGLNELSLSPREPTEQYGLNTTAEIANDNAPHEPTPPLCLLRSAHTIAPGWEKPRNRT